jgi:hypothetical protein
MEMGGISPLMLHFGARWIWVASLRPLFLYPCGKNPFHTTTKMVGAFQRRYGSFGERSASNIIKFVFQYSMYIARTYRDILRYLSALTKLSDHDSPEEYSERIYHAFFIRPYSSNFQRSRNFVIVHMSKLCDKSQRANFHVNVAWVWWGLDMIQRETCKPTSDRSHYCHFLSVLVLYLNPSAPHPPPKHSPSNVSCTSANNVTRSTFLRNFKFRTST